MVESLLESLHGCCFVVRVFGAVGRTGSERAVQDASALTYGLRHKHQQETECILKVSASHYNFQQECFISSKSCSYKTHPLLTQSYSEL